MAVLDRSELEASPLADLHAIADQIGLDGFRRLRKAELIDAIVGDTPAKSDSSEEDGEDRPRPARKRRAPRLRRGKAGESEDGAGAEADADEDSEDAEEDDAEDRLAAAKDEQEDKKGKAAPGTRSRGSRGGAGRSRGGRSGAGSSSSSSSSSGSSTGSSSGRSSSRGGESEGREESDEDAKTATGVVEVLGNGSAFLRVDPPEASDEDVYISAAQVRRCELVSGDRVTGPVRAPRRSERYPSLVRIDTINGSSADSVADGVRYDDLPVAWPSERLALGDDPTLEAIEWMAPIGKGSRAVIVGARHAGKSETLRRILAAFSSQKELELSLVLTGARPEEIGEWQEGAVVPSCALTFAASADSQAQAAERALDAARRVAARGGDALVLIDSLDGMQPQAARKVLAAARNLKDGGSLTVIATASSPVGGETTVIALDVALTAAGRQPILDLSGSGTLKAELLVGEDGAKAIAKARADALD
jgi:transcription termination factor Rho